MKYILLLLLIVIPIITNAQATDAGKTYINDSELIDSMTEEISQLFDAGHFTGVFDMRRQMEHRTGAMVQFNQAKPSKKKHFNYEQQKEGVLIIAKLFLCEKCPNYHITTASGFVLNEDGVCVTNHHVFRKFDNDPSMYLSVYAIDHKGNVFPIKEVMAGDEKNDLALFKIETDKQLKPLSIGSDAKVTDEVNLISHPDKMYYSYSDGKVTREYLNSKQKTPRQSISADFAKGSSGAPVFNDQGAVVGVISSTRSVYYRPKENQQMVVKEIIPISLLKEMCQRDMVNTPDKVGVPGMRP